MAQLLADKKSSVAPSSSNNERRPPRIPVLATVIAASAIIAVYGAVTGYVLWRLREDSKDGGTANFLIWIVASTVALVSIWGLGGWLFRRRQIA